MENKNFLIFIGYSILKNKSPQLSIRRTMYEQTFQTALRKVSRSARTAETQSAWTNCRLRRLVVIVGVFLFGVNRRANSDLINSPSQTVQTKSFFQRIYRSSGLLILQPSLFLRAHTHRQEHVRNSSHFGQRAPKKIIIRQSYE